MKGLSMGRLSDWPIAVDWVLGEIGPITSSSFTHIGGESVQSSGLCGTGMPHCGTCPEVSVLTAPTPAGVPVPHEVVRQAPRRLRAAWQIILAALREVFDENAYERFLARTQDTRSAKSYRAFLRERETAIAQKPQCC